MNAEMHAYIYYPSYDIVINPWNPSVTYDDVNKHYVKMCEVDIPTNIILDDEDSIYGYLESLFALFNSENNPLCSEESQNHIIKNKLHTSMSVGDVININSEFYYASTLGFIKV